MAQIIATTVEPAVYPKDSRKLLRVAVYCRVSKLVEDQEGSFETQKRAYEEKIVNDPNLTLVKVYGDHGISGGSTRKRLQFQEMMQDCRDGLIDTIFTKSISRFARNLSDTIKYIRELRELGISVCFEEENINSMDSSMEMLLEIMSAVAQEELNDMSRNIKWSLEKSRSAGNPKTAASYGYRKCMQGDQCLWKICEPEADRVRCAFRMAADGKMYWEILEQLQQMEEEQNTGIAWTRERLHRILTHEAYIGNLVVGKNACVDCLSKKTVRNHGEYPLYLIEGHHEPMITEEQFEKVQDNLKNKLLRARNLDEVPERWRSRDWKHKHGFFVPASTNVSILIKSCYTKSGRDNHARCVYGKSDCPGYRGGTGSDCNLQAEKRRGDEEGTGTGPAGCVPGETCGCLLPGQYGQ